MKPWFLATTSSPVTAPLRPRLTRGERRPQRPQQQQQQQQQRPWCHSPPASLSESAWVSRQDSQRRGRDEAPRNVHLLFGGSPAHPPRPAPPLGLDPSPSNCQSLLPTDGR